LRLERLHNPGKIAVQRLFIQDFQFVAVPENQRTKAIPFQFKDPLSVGRLVNVYNGGQVYTSMRTNIVIDDKLMRDALRATGLKTKREAVEEGLRTLLRLKRQAEIRRFRGKLDWRGDLDAMRSDS
jgi:Arc/MetJ family transcription regulator